MLLMRIGITSCIVFLILSLGELKADVIYGSIRFGDGRPANGAHLEIRCSGEYVYTGIVQSGGGYKIYVREQGSCTLRVLIGSPEVTPRAKVHSYDEPVRYDFEIVGGPHGYGLARR
jgi:hypothetical protein